MIQSMAVLAASAAVDISPIVERIPNGVYVVTGVVSVAISDGPCSDFMLNVPCPESSQYQDIEWLEQPPIKLIKSYKEGVWRQAIFLYPDELLRGTGNKTCFQSAVLQDKNGLLQDKAAPSIQEIFSAL